MGNNMNSMSRMDDEAQEETETDQEDVQEYYKGVKDQVGMGMKKE